MMRLPPKFFARPTLEVTRDLLGKKLVVLSRGRRRAGRILETEAYIGENDPACHARFGRTKRSEVLYWKPGTLYVYYTYGMHWLLNIVTERPDFPAAILIRAVEPIEGIAEGVRTDGPARLTKAFGIDSTFHGTMAGKKLWVEDDGFVVSPEAIKTGPRIGVGYAGKAKEWPWRFVLTGAHF
ncbi:MAG: DNA-3-methyladenine glycosylase [Candidatus Sungbacteria bacterium]|nr:DNA-3-methyladenine glycosylase [Candidatus Sungbacteria bacterium]